MKNPDARTIGEAYGNIPKSNDLLAECDRSDTVTYQSLDQCTDVNATRNNDANGTSPKTLLLSAAFDCSVVAGLLSVAKTRHAVLTVDAGTPLRVVLDLFNDQQP